jgi:hypothetical protein
VSYEFVVLTPEFARSDAANLHRALRAGPSGQPPPVLTDFLASLSGAADLTTAEPSADARGVVLRTRWEIMPATLRTLLELTADFGLPLYDPQVDRMYDPRGGLRIEVSLGDGVKVPYVSRALLDEYVAQPALGAPFIVVQRDADHYAQAYLHRLKPADVECRAGGPDQHYAATTDRADVAAILWSWATGSDDWRSAVTWNRVAV